MRRQPLSSIARRGVCTLLVALSLALSSCEARGPFGLTEPSFKSILSRGDRAALLALPASAFDDPGPAGPAAWYFTALWLEDGAAKGDRASEASGAALVQNLL